PRRRRLADESETAVPLPRGRPLHLARQKSARARCVRPRCCYDHEMADTTVETAPGMVLVPAGPFLFGNDLQEVNLGAFLCDRDPVTYGEYGRFLKETGHPPPSGWPFGRLDEVQASKPVVLVAFADARAYARWAAKDLPTEAQW